ncbi:uncharacterized protein LOC131850847 [Achroia grisella]|uniref:uncharacterized protein LOC131847426 n=1 Tax=Achroia grisella TaxID=688607 RepID=UPI0027D32440|nr:uncharacterized protein LOC131847426 [Achroia grisella]XP_059056211.1 uncharacterized protein LOC131850076 [Achroia grisella]XP_059057205.1 uncharacterized protein LOC131850847 [Achroia grisella]
MDKQKRARSENWLEDDKNLLLELIRERVAVLENKNTDTNTNNCKKKGWLEVMDSFNAMCKGSRRTLQQIKSQWGVIKICKKKNLADQRRSLNKTGGGPPTVTVPVDSTDILAWLPQEFYVDTNLYDSDAKTGIPDDHINEIDVPVSAIPDKPREPKLNEKAPEMPEIILDLDEIIENSQSGSTKEYISNEGKKCNKKRKLTNTNNYIQKIADTEIKNKNELHNIQMDNERKKARNLDLEYEILQQKLIFYRKKNNPSP